MNEGHTSVCPRSKRMVMTYLNVDIEGCARHVIVTDGEPLQVFELADEKRTDKLIINVAKEDPAVAGVMVYANVGREILAAFITPVDNEWYRESLKGFSVVRGTLWIRLQPVNRHGHEVGNDLKAVICLTSRLKALPNWPRERGEVTPPQRRGVDLTNVRQYLPVLQPYSPSSRMPSQIWD